MEVPSVFGGGGFIGSVFIKMFPNTVMMSHDSLTPETSNIINFISTTDNYNVFSDPLLDIQTNEILLIHLLEEARRKYGSMFTFNMISSWFVYGDVPLPAKEDAYCNPKGFYSITKRAAEQLLISYCETYGIQYRILRLANVLGIEDKKVSAKKNALQYLINKIVHDEEIELYNDGMFHRDYIDVRDACFAIRKVATEGEINEIYNIGNGIHPLFRDLIMAAYKIAGKEPKIKSINPSAFHGVVQVKDMWLDNTKLKGIGYRPHFSMQDTLSRLVYHYNDRPLPNY